MKSREVNSFHNYQISGKMNDFRSVGYSDDGDRKMLIRPFRGTELCGIQKEKCLLILVILNF